MKRSADAVVGDAEAHAEETGAAKMLKMYEKRLAEINAPARELEDRIHALFEEREKLGRDLDTLNRDNRIERELAEERVHAYSCIQTLVTGQNNEYVIFDNDKPLASTIYTILEGDPLDNTVEVDPVTCEMLQNMYTRSYTEIKFVFKTKRYANRDSERDWYPEPDIYIDDEYDYQKGVILTEVDYDDINDGRGLTETDGDSDGLRDIHTVKIDCILLTKKK